MMFKTHIALAFLAGLYSISFFHPASQILFMALILFGGLLPDIDHPQSKLGKYFKPVSFLFEHRGFFHSLFVLPVISLLVYYFTKNIRYSLPIILGYSTHLISDAITKEGIMPFHPISSYRIKGFIHTGKLMEYVLFLIILSIDLYKLFSLTI